MSSPYIRLKLLIAPVQGAPSPSSSPSSSAPPPPPASISFLVKKVEVPRSLTLEALGNKLAKLYGFGNNNSSSSSTPSPLKFDVSLDPLGASLNDSDVSRSELVAHMSWKEVTSASSWFDVIANKEKLLVRITPRAGSVQVATAASSAKPFDVRVHMRPVMPPKSPAPWPKYNPDPKDLPIIIVAAENEWEVLDESDFAGMEVSDEKSCKSSSASTNYTSTVVSSSGKKVVAKVQGKSSTKMVDKPNRIVPNELLIKLAGGGSSTTTTPAPTSSITLAINGTSYTLENPSPTLKLIEYLRYEIGITGAKIGCGEGGCGACTVVLSHQDAKSGELVQYSSKACVIPIVALDGFGVTTTDGLGSEHTKLHPIQQSMVDKWATQCGYCTGGKEKPQSSRFAEQCRFPVSARADCCSFCCVFHAANPSLPRSGMVATMYGLLVNNATPTLQQIEDHFDGNICRCTGYRPIFAAMRAVVPGLEEEEKKSTASGSGACGCSSGGAKCGCASATSNATSSTSSCSSSSSSSSSSFSSLRPCGKGDGHNCSSSSKSACHSIGVRCGTASSSLSSSSSSSDMEDMCSTKYDPTNPSHNINPFPTSLVEYNHRQSFGGKVGEVRYVSDTQSIWFEPTSIADVSNILSYYKSQNDVVKLVVGNTSIGVEKYYTPNLSSDFPTIFINLANLEVLKSVSTTTNVSLDIGAANTITNVIALIDAAVAQGPATQYAGWSALSRHLKVVANTGIRNIASWAGNMMMAKNHPEFPSDLMTIFSGFGASLTLVSGTTGTRQINVADLPTTTFGTDEFIQTLHIPFTPSGFVFDSYKIRARRQNAHPIINTAYRLIFEPNRSAAGNLVIQYANIVIGGLTLNGIFRPTNTITYLSGKELNAATLAGALAQLDAEAVPGLPPSGSTFYIADPNYRHSLVLTTFYKFYLEQMSVGGSTIPSRDQSAYEWYQRPISNGSEIFTPDPSEAPVGQPIPKIESKMQTTGEAKYVDDMELPTNGLWGAYVFSKVAIGTIESIDASVALAMPGVVRLLTAADIAALPGAANDCGAFPGDEEVFATKNITATGQAIGMILADTRAHADAAAAAVVVNITPSTATPIISVADAIAAKSFLPDNKYMSNPPPITCGNFATAYASAPNKFVGASEIGGQAHFFMETQTCLSVPIENDGLHVYASCQGPTDIRAMILRVTGLPAHKIIVSTRRCGGGFGGKLSRSHPIASATALAARIMNRPIKAQCDRGTDMIMWGKRPEFYNEYQIGFDNTGKILAYNVDFYQQGGRSYDANFGTMSMCLLWADNAYYVPNFTATGFTCLTNTPTNTAMRGPGAFTSIQQMENTIEAIATYLNMSPDDVRSVNFYTDGQLTPYQQTITNSTMSLVTTTLKTQSNYEQVKADVAAFNAANKWRKQGVHITACKYGIADPGNQVGILMNVMQDDGTIIVSHTGVEIGQGINTKVAQTIAYKLGIDMSLIIIDDNSTNLVANGSQTGGSATSESACAAAILACQELTTRLQATKTANPSATWPALIALAAAAQVNLTVNTQYNLPAPSIPFTYFVWSSACSRVEIDVLTGEVTVLQTDIVYDCGNSLNPAVDIGQIEGAFIIGLGHYLTEDIVYDEKTGLLRTRGTWDYHPPSSQDIPISMNVTFLKNQPNTAPGSIMGSKATAEPPMMLSGSVFFAVKDAIAAARADKGITGWFELAAPASTQNIQLACGVTTAELVL